ncbi:MAG: glycosyltransferase [Phycisphaerales bacterium]|jgi:glycosyltransferase involved in cell wall biosynthesis
MENRCKRLLVFNCHEAWVHQLRLLGYDMDIICGLAGHHVPGWDTHVRPVPNRARLISLDEALTSGERYACIIAHNPTDLMDVRNRTEPRLLVLHLSLNARLAEERPNLTAEQAKQLLHRYVELSGAHVAAVTLAKGKSWGFTEDITPFGLEPGEYPPCTGQTACGLRVSNFILRRKKSLLWSLHEQAFTGLPIRIVGHNPDMPGVSPSRDWDHLRDLLRTSRFFIHTANPDLEDGYNIAMLEAMAAGLPVVGNRHPTSIIEHGVSGFLSDDPVELRNYAKRLLEDKDLALRMGRQARLTIQQCFTPEAFRSNMERAIASAQRKRELLSQPKPAAVELPRRSGRLFIQAQGVPPEQNR